jgi:hypothetical protein
MIRVLAAALLWPSFHGCDRLMLFTEPQPVGADTLASFPEEWWGCYRQQDDSTYLEVTADAFTVTSSGRVSLGEEELLPDTAEDPLWVRLQMRIAEGLRDTIFVVDGSTIHLQVTAEQHMLLFDEVGAPQRIGKEFSLRRLGARLCLSVPHDSLPSPAYQVDVWERQGTKFRWRVLSGGYLERINKVVDLPGDTLNGPVTVTRKQFSRLVTQGAYEQNVVMIPCAWCASTLSSP